jgi:NAD(P)-dependent dehydrogenase (short-subunit alcohol dehydrogenase family)
MADETTVITGANNGIGLALTEALVNCGHKVAALDISGENIGDLIQVRPNDCCFYACDVTNPDNVETTIHTILVTLGSIDVLVNNACLAILADFEDKPLSETRREFEVNYFGYLNMILAVLPIMKAQGHGVIHNVSSGVGITGFPGIYGYASTKGAIEALTRTLAIEFAPYGITVNTIHPPLTRTKSASPLGIPEQMMADPKIVGQKLAPKIGGKRPALTPDFSTAIGLFSSRHFPEFIGGLMAKMARRTQKEIDG